MIVVKNKSRNRLSIEHHSDGCVIAPIANVEYLANPAPDRRIDPGDHRDATTDVNL